MAQGFSGIVGSVGAFLWRQRALALLVGAVVLGAVFLNVAADIDNNSVRTVTGLGDWWGPAPWYYKAALGLGFGLPLGAMVYALARYPVLRAG